MKERNILVPGNFQSVERGAEKMIKRSLGTHVTSKMAPMSISGWIVFLAGCKPQDSAGSQASYWPEEAYRTGPQKRGMDRFVQAD
jgi:hypothetical protein